MLRAVMFDIYMHSPSSLVRPVTSFVKFDWPLLLTAAPLIVYSVYFDKFPTVPFRAAPSNVATVM